MSLFRPEVGHLSKSVKLEESHRGTTRMMKGVEQLLYQDQLKMPGAFTPQKKRKKKGVQGSKDQRSV